MVIVGKLENRKDIKTYKGDLSLAKKSRSQSKGKSYDNSRNCGGGSTTTKKKKKKRKTPEKGYNPHRSEKYGFYLENVRWEGGLDNCVINYSFYPAGPRRFGEGQPASQPALTHFADRAPGRS